MGLRFLIDIPFLTLTFMHCKNIVMEPKGYQPGVRRRHTAHREPAIRHYTLNIHPVKRLLAGEGRIEKNGLKRAMHICRGHFRHYTEDAPLFGHYTGTVFVPMHTRGNKERGEVKKNYKVRPE